MRFQQFAWGLGAVACASAGSPVATLVSNTSSQSRDQGFVGVYHPAENKTVRCTLRPLRTAAHARCTQPLTFPAPALAQLPGNASISVADEFHFGIVAIENSQFDSGIRFTDDLEAHCGAALATQQVVGLVLPPTEGGVVSAPNDTSQFLPLAKGAGIVQGAARFSRLSATGACAQVSGIVIDDFATNYIGDVPRVPSATCATCPASAPFVYGSFYGGFFCCSQAPAPTAGHCPDAAAPCCLDPGRVEQCQGAAHPRCGTNPTNAPPCGFADGITLDEMREIKGALQGRRLFANGTVDWASPATTPHLRLFVVIYNRLVPSFLAAGLLNESVPPPERGSGGSPLGSAAPIVDGVSLWIEGPSQNAEHANLTRFVRALRVATDALRLAAALPPLALTAGGYLAHSRTGVLPPGPFEDLLRQAVAMYAAPATFALEGFYLFAGGTISSFNATEWAEWNLPGMLDAQYSAHVGHACVALRYADGTPPPGRAFDVRFGDDAVFVARTQTDARGTACFGGYADGRARHTVRIAGVAPFSVALAPRRALAYAVDLGPKF